MGIAVAAMTVFCIFSIITPIRFEETRKQREPAVIARLIDIRAAEVEYKLQKGYYTNNIDSLILFLNTAKKKEIKKEGALTDVQLEKGLTEAKAVDIIRRGNAKEIAENGLENFRRDTIVSDLLPTLYQGKYTAENLISMFQIPYCEQKFEMLVNNEFTNAQGTIIHLFEARAPYSAYLGDLNEQERINLKDREEKLEHYPGLRVGNISTPNNNAGNWE